MPTPPVNSDIPAVIGTPLPLEPARYVRNGMLPSALFESDAAAQLNSALYARRKQFFSWGCDLLNIPSGDIVARNRWRFAGHTGLALRRLRATVLLARQDHGASGNPSVTLYITNADESIIYAQATAAFGASPNGSSDTPNEFGPFSLELDGVPSDTPIYGRFEDSADGRIVGATVYEEAKKISAANGYVVPQGVAVTGPIYDQRRQDMYELATNMWKKNAAHLWNWTSDLDTSPFTTSSATPTNVIDSATTGAASTSASLDLRYCRTRSTDTVPCVLKVYAKMSGASDTGIVRISGANGGFIDSVNVTGTTAQWYSVSLNLDAAEDTFYVEGYNGSAGLETLSVYAFSLYQYAA